MKDHLKETGKGPVLVDTQGGKLTGDDAVAILNFVKGSIIANNAPVDAPCEPATSEPNQ